MTDDSSRIPDYGHGNAHDGAHTGDTGHEQDEVVRGDVRDSLFLRGTVSLGTHPAAEVRIRNLSPGGCLVESALPASVGSRVSILLPNVGTQAGVVAWAGAGRFGITFANTIDPAKVRRRVSVPFVVPASVTHMQPWRGPRSK